MRSAILTNPHSNRNRRHLPRLRTLLERRGVRHVETATLADLPGAVATLLDDGIELLAINGGDGTVHLVLTALLHAANGRPLPTLALLPGGTTSMSARGVNDGAVPFDRALDALMDALRGDYAGQPRHLVKVHASGADAQLGLCFGMGAVVRGIEYCHQRIYSLGIRDEFAAGAAMLRAGWGIARREAVFADGVPLDLHIGNEHHTARASIFLITTLSELILGIDPFWGEGAAPLRITLVREHAERFLRSFPDLLRGRAKPHLTETAGYLSRRGSCVAIRGEGPYTIDGEIYRAPCGEISVEAFGPVSIVSLGKPR